MLAKALGLLVMLSAFPADARVNDAGTLNQPTCLYLQELSSDATSTFITLGSQMYVSIAGDATAMRKSPTGQLSVKLLLDEQPLTGATTRTAFDGAKLRVHASASAQLDVGREYKISVRGYAPSAQSLHTGLRLDVGGGCS